MSSNDFGTLSILASWKSDLHWSRSSRLDSANKCAKIFLPLNLGLLGRLDFGTLNTPLITRGFLLDLFW